MLGENVVEDAGHAVGLIVYDVGDEQGAGQTGDFFQNR